jgi:hypothetical protein|tara:strand:- start:1211 stop:1558 length:348 start_codon:yes stop_codon:yes gene_type:complete
MNKVITLAAAGILMAAPAMAAGPIALNLSTDTAYNLDTEVVTTDVGITGTAMNLSAGVTPTINLNDQEITNIKLDVSYGFSINDTISVTPYAEANWDTDGNAGDQIIGIKTSLDF